MLVYPQLPPPASRQLVQERSRLSVAELEKLAAAEHRDQIYTPTGTRADQTRLLGLRQQLLHCAREAGCPEPPDQVQRLRFDAYAGRVLHHSMEVVPAEAAKGGVWEFLSLVLLPDLVRWRWLDAERSAAPAERFLSGRRNTFERVWRRAFLLHDPGRANPYEMLDELGEDELVQIVERPYLSGNRHLARLMATEFLTALDRNPVRRRRDYMREAQKRFMRLSSFVSFAGLQEAEMAGLLRSTYDRVAELPSFRVPGDDRASTVV